MLTNGGFWGIMSIVAYDVAVLIKQIRHIAKMFVPKMCLIFFMLLYVVDFERKYTCI